MKVLAALREFIRPLAVAALLAVLMLGAVLSGVLEIVLPGKGIAFTIGVAGWFKAIPAPYYELLTVGLLGYAAGRTVEKSVRSYVEAKYTPPARPVPDDPEGGQA